jgi:hypothetical protein
VPTNVAGRLRSLTRRLETFDQVIVSTAGKIVADSVLDQMTRDSHGGTMSGIGKNGTRLDIKLTPLSSPKGVRIQPNKAGPWAILSSGTSAHLVAAKNKRRRGRGNSSRARAMRIGGAWRAGPWRVGGSRGKGTWTKGADAGFDEALTKVRAMFSKAVAGG